MGAKKGTCFPDSLFSAYGLDKVTIKLITCMKKLPVCISA